MTSRVNSRCFGDDNHHVYLTHWPLVKAAQPLDSTTGRDLSLPYS